MVQLEYRNHLRSPWTKIYYPMTTEKAKTLKFIFIAHKILSSRCVTIVTNCWQSKMLKNLSLYSVRMSAPSVCDIFYLEVPGYCWYHQSSSEPGVDPGPMPSSDIKVRFLCSLPCAKCWPVQQTATDVILLSSWEYNFCKDCRDNEDAASKTGF